MLFRDSFTGADSGLLFRETFGPNSLDHYTVVDEGTNLGPSQWSVAAGQIRQTSNIYGGSVDASEAAKPGTVALTGAGDWANIRITARLHSTDDDGIGVVFRYKDGSNYYRFSMDAERSFRRLIKKVNGSVSVIWQDATAYSVGANYTLVLVAYNDRILGYLNDELLFAVTDDALRAGQVGLYCWANTGAFFDQFMVERLPAAPVLWEPALTNMSGVDVYTESGAASLPAQWAAAGGVLTQASKVHVNDPGMHKPGTYAIGLTEALGDVQISAMLRSSDNGALGVMFRYQDADNYCRFSMDNTLSYRRLIRKVKGLVSVLWQDAVAYSLNRDYRLTIRARGSELRGFLDGAPLFTVYDGEIPQGRVAFYTWSDSGASFSRVLVADATLRLGAWTIHDQGTAGAPSVWQLRDGSLVQLSSIGGGAVPASPGSIALVDGVSMRDGRLIVRLRSDSDQALGVVFRYVDASNYYRLSLNAAPNYRRLIKRVNGVTTVLWQAASGYPVGDSLELVVDMAGDRITAYQGGTQLFAMSDAGHREGQIGVYTANNPGARFEYVDARALPLESWALLHDRFATAGLAGWTVLDEGSNAGPSAWSVFEGGARQTSDIFSPPDDRDTLAKPGTLLLAGDAAWRGVVFTALLRSLDNDTIGVVFRYAAANRFYRFSMDSQRKYRRLVKNVGGVYTLLWEDDVAYAPGRDYRLTIVADGPNLRGDLDGVPLFVVDDSDIPAGKIGLYCWQNTDARFSDVAVYTAGQIAARYLLDDPLYVLVAGRWAFMDDGNQEGPSAWAIKDGRMHQSSLIHGGAAAGADPDKPGTFSVAGDLGWRDYRVSVKLQSDTTEALGVMFRYRDSHNYYRFSMDRARGYRRLIKKVAGVATTLWQDTVQYTSGKPYMATIDCVDHRITGYLNSERLFSVEDLAFDSGWIALYCWHNKDAYFSEVRVSPAVWTPYHAFGEEMVLPAGSRLRIFSGNAAGAPPAVPGVLMRFRATLGDRGRIQLTGNSTRLRLRAPQADTGHEREFLRDNLYAVVSYRILRKADGTGWFLIVPSGGAPGSQLAPGEYRLTLTYRRDNRARDPQSLMLSEAGRRGAEVVTLDVPWNPVT